MNRHVVITGASRGLGLCIARAHVGMGDRVYCLCLEDSGELVSLMASASEQVQVYRVDVGHTDEVRKAAREVASQTARIDLLYNNAGVYSFADKVALEDTDPDRLAWYYNINAVGPVRTMQSFLPLMGEGSRVINISSEAGSISQCRRGREYGYCMSKAAQNMATRIFGIASAARGITALAIHPGWMRTQMGGQAADCDPAESARKIVSLALGQADVPPGAQYLDCDGNRWEW